MENLKKLKNELNSCSKCGLCQAVCPVFQVTKNDCTSLRGKIILLNELLKKEQKPSKTLKLYMELCTNCGKCSDYCPVKIDVLKINEAFYKDFPSVRKKLPLNLAIFHPFLCMKLIKNKYLQNIKKMLE